MKLEVGMYVRFESVLCRIDEIVDNYISFDMEIYDHWNEPIFSMNYERFINDYKPKYSFDIIDLIEVGDYVNGYKVRGTSISTLLLDNFNMIQIDEEDIKSIVTKEQFESVQYKVGE